MRTETAAPALSIQHLLRDHRNIEKILDGLESLLDAKKKDPSWNTAASRALEVLTGALERQQRCHIRKEEDVLFPFLEKFLPSDSGPLLVLRGEHQDLSAGFRSMLQAGEALLQEKAPANALGDLERFGRRTIQLARDHIYKEDRVLFPMVTRFLSSDQDASLLAGLEAIRCGG